MPDFTWLTLICFKSSFKNPTIPEKKSSLDS